MGGTPGREKLDSRGFTLLEVLAVVAVTAVLLTLAAPSMLRSWRELRLTELDGTAREIFLSAQNELTERKSSGRLTDLTAGDGVVLSDTVTAGAVTQTVRYVTSASGAGTLTQTASLLSALGGTYLLYLNPLSGDVTAVYYAKETLDTAQVLSLYRSGSDDQDLRARLGIGYYGGLNQDSAGQGTGEDSGHVAAGLKIVNGEDLYVELTYPGLSAAVTDAGQIAASVTVTDTAGTAVTLTADGDSATGSTPANRVRADVITNGDYTLDVLLDSLTDGASFAALPAAENGTKLTPGDAVTVSVTLKCGGTVLYANQSVGPVNSLFASRTAGGSAAAPVTECAALCARQLYNVSVYCASAASSETVTARLGRTIDFSDIQTRGKTLMPGDSLAAAFPSLVLSSPVRGVTLDGGGYVLKNFTFSSAASQGLSCTGLVGYCDQTLTLKDLLLENPTVQGTQNVGALAGMLSNAGGALTVTGCGVYRTDGDGAVSGLAAGETAAGGLIGSVQASAALADHPITISDSFAALPVSAAGTGAGGLIGSIAGGTVKNCYASGQVSAAGGQSGGLAGRAAGQTTIDGCFATSDVSAPSEAGALTGRTADAASFSDTRAYGTVSRTGTAVTTYGPLCGSGAPSYAACDYLSQSGNGAVLDAYRSGTCPDGVAACEYADLTVSGNRESDTHPYDPSLSGAFPFRMLRTADGAVIPYYGNWPEEIHSDRLYGLCYYETYLDGSGQTSWGFAGYSRGGEIINTLQGNDLTITAAGYGVAVSPGAAASAPTGTAGEAALGAPESLPGLDLYPIPDAATELPVAAGATGCRVTDGTAGRTVYLNPSFAASVSLSALSADAASPLQIRTEEQLRARGTVSGSGWYFRQTHNIPVTLASTGLLTNGGGCTYDGADNTITGLRSALFASSDGTLKNIRLQDVRISASGNTAGLAVNAQGTVADCAVLSGSIASSGGSAAGLILNMTGGTVAGCTVGTSGGTQDLTVAGSGFSGQSGASGLIGTAGASPAPGSSVTISECAVAEVSVTNSSGRAAGLVTFNLDAQITGCSVSGTDVSASDHAGGFCVDNYDSIRFGSVDNCRVTSTGSAAQGGGAWPYAAGFAYCNKGEQSAQIADSRASQITVTGPDAASGFVHENESAILRCYAVPDAVTGADAAGFVLRNSRAASTVSDCFAVSRIAGAVAGTSESGGFTATNAGTMTRCYAAISLTESAGTIYGFGPSGGTASDCFWCRDAGFNRGVSVSAGAGSRIMLEALKTLAALNTADWTADNANATHPVTMTGAYPYPRLSAQDYYGDWPEATAAAATTSGKLAAMVLYRQNQGNGQYGGSGCAVDFSVSSDAQTYSAKTKFGSAGPYVLLSQDLAQSGEWTVTVGYRSFLGTASQYELDLTQPTASSLTLTNLTGCMGYRISAYPYGGTLQTVTFANADTGETYTFAYSSANGTFSS